VANPAYQLTGAQYSATGAFGTAPFGTSPFGGSGYNPYDLPMFNIGGDDLRETRRRKVARIVHRRSGMVVSARTLDYARVWTAQHAVVTQDDLDVLWVYCNAGTFDLLPAGDPSNTIPVLWVDAEFNPQYLSPGKYSLSYTIEEVIT